MKKLYILSALCLAAFSMNAQQVTANVATDASVAATVPAETLKLKETEYNFGKIPQGKPVTHIFEITNTGKTAYKLDNVQASCGCTTPEWNKDELIQPNATAKITVGYNAAAEGMFAKNITITYNGNQTKTFMIKGEVWKTPATSAPANEGLTDLKN
ncbi:MAG: DUF1573 domain-containing protein [Bacteroidetes bacterium]|nr:DUF1573 domain-containing protein [Bacteroidota bacterium]MBS1757216.1 DUF1573 domain-containing protein [Bacteroidota bacterium]